MECARSRAQQRSMFRARAFLRACLKNPTEIRSLRFGVPRSARGSGAVPPKGGTPNAIFRHALRGLLAFGAAAPEDGQCH